MLEITSEDASMNYIFSNENDLCIGIISTAISQEVRGVLLQYLMTLRKDGEP